MWDPSWLEPVVSGVVLFVVIVVVLELLSRFLRALARRAGSRTTTLRAIRDTFRVLWIIAGAIIGLSIAAQAGFGSQLTILTISGLAGLVVTLSLQTVFSNIIAGILLLQDKAVRVGDVIEFSGVKGRVARVALRNTWLVTDSGTIAIIGNNALLGGPLVNHSASKRYATELEIR